MSKLFVTGDTHGEQGRLLYSGAPYNIHLKEDDYLFICGDFGYLFSCKEDRKAMENAFLDKIADEKPYTICFVDGNHENFPSINSYPIEIWCGGKAHIIRRDKNGKPKIIHLMRGQIFTIDEKRIFTFGGGYSIDKHMRREGESWWKEEMPTDEEIKEANRNLKVYDWKVDYILTHAAPEETMNIFHPYHADEKNLNNYLEFVRENTEYKHWYFGHLHVDEELWKNQTALFYKVYDMINNVIVEPDEG